MFSALLLRADVAQCSRHVRFVPRRDSCTAANGNDSRPIVAPTKSTEKRACKGYTAALARSFGSMFTDLRHRTESYPAPGTGAGLSGALPTETGPTGLGSGET